MDLNVEVGDWCPFERITKNYSYCEIDEDEMPCKFGQTGKLPKNCPLRKGRIILERKKEGETT